MDLNDFWQENKRFLIMIGSGLLVFLIASQLFVDPYVDEVQRLQGSRASVQRNLTSERYSSCLLYTSDAADE